jgi:hypothetical protein
MITIGFGGSAGPEGPMVVLVPVSRRLSQELSTPMMITVRGFC